jgi:hypothetical protein
MRAGGATGKTVCTANLVRTVTHPCDGCTRTFLRKSLRNRDLLQHPGPGTRIADTMRRAGHFEQLAGNGQSLLARMLR